MAKHNFVLLYGQVARDPTIFKNEQTGTYIRGVCPLTVIRGIRSSEVVTRQVKYDNPVVMSGNPEQIEAMAEWKVGDMVLVKGSITTKSVIKSKTCEHCQEKNHKNGMVVYITPIFSVITDRGKTTEEGVELLRRNSELSNLVFAIGSLCADPQVFQTANGTLLTTYEIAISRKFRVQDDTIDSKTDFPWVKSYGLIANSDAKLLHKGSLIYVDGFLQTRKIEKRHICQCCGKEFSWPDSSMEIVPYSTEYLRNYKTPEEIAEQEQIKYEMQVKKIFAESDILYETSEDYRSDDDEGENNS